MQGNVDAQCNAGKAPDDMPAIHRPGPLAGLL